MTADSGALSLTQTPPLGVPLRFLLTAPLFLAAAGLVLILAPDALLVTRWSPAMLALTHLVTLGFLGSCMLGAMQQLIPVLAGVTLPDSDRLSRALFWLWTPGTVLLIAGMAWRWAPGLQGGAGLLAAAVVLFTAVCGWALGCSASRHDTLRAMGIALLGLLAGVALAVWLLWQSGWQVPVAHPLTRLHIGWAALPWIAGLIAAVAYQVVPMFQLTPPYPLWLRRVLIPLLLILTALWSVWPGPWLSAGAAGVLVVFAAWTLRLQQRRRRRMTDPTLDFWRIAMVCLILAALAWLLWLYRPGARLEILVGVLFLAGFATAAVNGMLYKIVPFLIWLHLANRRQESGGAQAAPPGTRQIIPARHARGQWWLSISALALLSLTVLLPLPAWPAGVLWAANGLYLAWNLLGALRCYRRHGG